MYVLIVKELQRIKKCVRPKIVPVKENNSKNVTVRTDNMKKLKNNPYLPVVITKGVLRYKNI